MLATLSMLKTGLLLRPLLLYFKFSFILYVFCLHVCVCPAHRDQKRVGIRSLGTGVTTEDFEQPCVSWELLLVALKCSAFSPALYFLRHSCFKRMCSGDWPGTQASICLCLPSAGIKFIKKPLNWPRSGNINRPGFSRINCILPHLHPLVVWTSVFISVGKVESIFNF